MIKIEVNDCWQCLFLSYLPGPIDKHTPVCLATRVGMLAGFPVSLPTRLPEGQVGNFIEAGENLPEPPDWCPLRRKPIILALKGTMPHIPDEPIPSMWPEDIGKPRVAKWETGKYYEAGRKVYIDEVGLVFVSRHSHNASEHTKPRYGSNAKMYWKVEELPEEEDG